MAREREPNQRGGEGADRGDAVEIVDRDAPFLGVVVLRPLLGELHDALADGGMEEPDADGRGEAGAARLDRLERPGALQDVLRGLEESMPGDFGGEPAGSGQGLDHPIRPLGRITD